MIVGVPNSTKVGRSKSAFLSTMFGKSVIFKMRLPISWAYLWFSFILTFPKRNGFHLSSIRPKELGDAMTLTQASMQKNVQNILG